MNNYSGGCSAAIGSITQAMKAQKLLAAAAIPTTVIKNEDKGSNGKGCVYGLGFSCLQYKNVQTVLAQERIKVKQWNGI